MNVNFKRLLENAICTVIIIIIWFGIDCLAGISISFFEIVKCLVTVLVSVIIVKKVDKKNPNT